MADYTVKADVDTFIRSNNQAEMRTNIGAGTIATQNANNVSITGGSVTGITDLAIADGGTGAGTASGARTNLEVYSDAEVDAKVATKATAGGVNVNSGLIYFSTMPAPRTNDFSFFGTINKQTAGLKRVYGSLQINGNLLMFISATNKIIVVHWGSPDLVSTDSIELNVDTHIGYTRNGTVGTFYINGKSAGIVTDSRDYLSNFANITATGDGMPGNHKDFKFFNRALSAAEVADLYESGTVAVADRWGDGAEGGTYTSDFSVNEDGWIALRGTVAGNIDSIGGENDTLRFTANNDYTAIKAIRAFTAINTLKKDKKYLIKYSYYMPSTNAVLTHLREGLWDNGTLNNYARAFFAATQDAWTETSIELTPNFGGSNDYFIIAVADSSGETTGSDGDVFYIKDVTVTELGCIADLPLDEGIGYQFHDRSINHFDALASTSGVTHLVPKTEGYIRDFNVDAYNGGSGNTELVSSSRAIIPSNANPVLLSVTSNNTAASVTGTLALKRSAGGSAQNTGETVTLNYLAGAKSYNSFGMDFNENGYLSTTRNNLAVTATDADATDLDIRVDYKIIE